METPEAKERALAKTVRNHTEDISELQDTLVDLAEEVTHLRHVLQHLILKVGHIDIETHKLLHPSSPSSERLTARGKPERSSDPHHSR